MIIPKARVSRDLGLHLNVLSLKNERVHRSRYRTRDEARFDILDYIKRF